MQNWYKQFFNNNMINIGILVDNEFEDSELAEPKKHFESKDEYNVIMIGEDVNKDYKGKNGTVVNSDVSIESINVESIDFLIIPGGKSPERLRKNESVISFIKEFNDLSKPIAAICHGPLVLIDAGLMSDVEATGYSGIKDDLLNAGASFVDNSVVIDGNIITSRLPKDIPDFIEAIEGYISNNI